jgi:hypothetical protein
MAASERFSSFYRCSSANSHAEGTLVPPRAGELMIAMRPSIPNHQMQSGHRSRLAFALLFIAMILGSIPAIAAPNLTFHEGGATASVQAGGDVIWFVHSLSEFSGSPMLSRKVEITSDSDEDGLVELELPVRPSSVWVVVDLATGEYSVKAPNGTTPKSLREHGDFWSEGRAELDFDRSDLDVLLVRPGEGAWVQRCVQGGAGDGDDRADGKLRVSLARMESIYGSAGTLQASLAEDLFIAIDPRDLTVFVHRADEERP